jgi:hypothetical protein
MGRELNTQDVTLVSNLSRRARGRLRGVLTRTDTDFGTLMSIDVLVSEGSAPLTSTPFGGERNTNPQY